MASSLRIRSPNGESESVDDDINGVLTDGNVVEQLNALCKPLRIHMYPIECGGTRRIIPPSDEEVHWVVGGFTKKGSPSYSKANRIYDGFYEGHQAGLAADFNCGTYAWYYMLQRYNAKFGIIRQFTFPQLRIIWNGRSENAADLRYNRMQLVTMLGNTDVKTLILDFTTDPFGERVVDWFDNEIGTINQYIRDWRAYYLPEPVVPLRRRRRSRRT